MLQNNYSITTKPNGNIKLVNKSSVTWFSYALFFNIFVWLLALQFLIISDYDISTFIIRLSMLSLVVFSIFWSGSLFLAKSATSGYEIDVHKRSIQQQVTGAPEHDIIIIPNNALLLHYSYRYTTPSSDSITGADRFLSMYVTAYVVPEESETNEAFMQRITEAYNTVSQKVYTDPGQTPLLPNAKLLKEHRLHAVHQTILYSIVMFLDNPVLDFTKYPYTVTDKSDFAQSLTEKNTDKKGTKNTVKERIIHFKRMPMWLPIAIFIVILLPLSAFYGFFATLKNHEFMPAFLSMTFFWLSLLSLRQRIKLSGSGIRLDLLMWFIPLIRIENIKWEDVGMLDIRNENGAYLEFLEAYSNIRLFEIQLYNLKEAERIQKIVVDYARTVNL